MNNHKIVVFILTFVSLIKSVLQNPKGVMRHVAMAGFIALLSACGSQITKPSEASLTQKQSDSRYIIDQDTAPLQHRDMTNAPDAMPKVEPYSRGGNKPAYEVWGKQYYVLPSSRNFREEGIASWYGKKFHGHLTSNGEIYDMFAMSAAHKHLPIPTYARVTNLENNRVVIVRINDRGPFHNNRIIDLSYAAASKLDYHKKGVAKVLVETIDASTWTVAGEKVLRNQRQLVGTVQGDAVQGDAVEPSSQTVKIADNKPVEPLPSEVNAVPLPSETSIAAVNATIVTLAVTGASTDADADADADAQPAQEEQRPPAYYVQVGAFRQLPYAKEFAGKVTKKTVRSDVQVEESSNDDLYRVLIGPIGDEKSSQLIRQEAIKVGYTDAMLLKP